MEILNRIIDLLGNSDQKELTDYLNLKKSAFTDWKSGKSNSYRKYLIEIAEYFNVSIDYLVYGKTIENTISPDLTENEKKLTNIEEKLLKDFRSLSQQGQDYIRQQMFMAREVYKNDNLPQSNLNAG